MTPGMGTPGAGGSEGLDLRSVGGRQIEALDGLRARGRVVWSEAHGWMVLGHQEVRTVLDDHMTFSNRVSDHVSVPNGMDPPEHTRYRRVVESFFDDGWMSSFEPRCIELARELVEELPRDEDLDTVAGIGEELALRVQTAFLGWPPELRERLRRWTHANRKATRAGHRNQSARVADEFTRQVAEILADRRRLGHEAPDDPTTGLLGAEVEGRPLQDAEITSIVRNWTMGEVGTITSSVGIVVGFLATHPEIQDDLRARPDTIEAAVDEMLRIDGPLMANRRVATCPVELGGASIEAGDRLTVLWPSANRDESVFGDPDGFDPHRNADQNLLYGAGIHVCPGAPLARMQLTVLARELLAGTDRLVPAARPPERSTFPAGGHAALWVRLQ